MKIVERAWRNWNILSNSGISRRCYFYRVELGRLLHRKSRYHFWPIGWLALSFDSLGAEFKWRGDDVIYTWPWRYCRERRMRGPFISLGFSGTGEWGDARFHSLRELDAQWELFAEASSPGLGAGEDTDSACSSRSG